MRVLNDEVVIIKKIFDALSKEEVEVLLEMFDGDRVGGFEVEFVNRYPEDAVRIFTPEFLSNCYKGVFSNG